MLVMNGADVILKTSHNSIRNTKTAVILMVICIYVRVISDECYHGCTKHWRSNYCVRSYSNCFMDKICQILFL